MHVIFHSQALDQIFLAIAPGGDCFAKRFEFIERQFSCYTVEN